jgi:hypothetical protein
MEVQFSPTEVLDPISREYVWPSEIHLSLQPSGEPPSGDGDPTSVQLLMGSLYEHAFITYLAKNEAAMKAKLFLGRRRGLSPSPEIGRASMGLFMDCR